jgi:ribulose-bisphosphate carboxylase large chain
VSGEIEVVYRVRADPEQIAGRAEALLLEQTVELPRSCLGTAFVRDHVVGRVVEVTQAGADTWRVTIAQPEATAAGDPAQLLNVLCGNSSLQEDIELEDVRVPLRLGRELGGPRFGIAGLRRVTGVAGRALTATALKPMGLSVVEIAELCRTFALGGIDVIKDDHGLADHSFCPFADRVRSCLAATEDVAQSMGRRAVYVPNLIGTPATVRRQAEQARELGAQAVMVSPMLVGLAFLNELVRNLGLPVLAHPAFGGAQRVAPEALFGRLFPLFGADAVIFPNSGGRFSYSAETCQAVARNLRNPLPPANPALPVPAGGIKAASAGKVLGDYGSDVMLLVGGSLLEPSGSPLVERCRQFVGAVHSFPYES